MSAFPIVCPCCQAVFPLEAALNDVAAREAVVEAFRLTPVGDLLLAYIGLFKPPKRALAMTRTARLLKELLPMIKEAKIESHGRIWSAPQEYWRMAFTEMIEKRDRLTLPLKSHGYLFAVIEGYSNKAEAQQEAQSEVRKAGHTAVGSVQMPQAPKFKGAPKPRSKIPHEVLALANTKSSRQGGSDGND